MDGLLKKDNQPPKIHFIDIGVIFVLFAAAVHSVRKLVHMRKKAIYQHKIITVS